MPVWRPRLAFAFRWGLRLSPMLVATSTRPFNMTVGRDLNGDTIFTDRPAFATDLSRPSVVRTDRKSTRLNSSHLGISYAVFFFQKKKIKEPRDTDKHQHYKHETVTN